MKLPSVVILFLLPFFTFGGWSAAEELPSEGGPDAANQREVWIAIRTDGKTGSGTPSDPLDGSTAAKFDGLMKAFPARTTIHLAPGLFPTTGASAYHLKTGWKIVGAGMRRTVLRLVGFDHFNNKSWVLSSWSESDDVEVRDLTIDGNYAMISKTPGWIAGDAVAAIDVYGGNVAIENVETIHLYGDGSKQLEEFSILLGGTPRRIVRNCRIIHCITHEYAISPKAGGYTFGPAIAYCNGGQILNCTDDGALHGFGGGIGENTLLQGNTTTTNTSVGWYSDTATLRNLTITGNHFGASLIPLQWNNPNPGSAHFKIVNNTFISSSNSNPKNTAAIRLEFKGLSDVLIRGNHVDYTGKGNYQFMTNGCHNTGLTIEDNDGTAAAGGSVFLSYNMSDILRPGNIVEHNHFTASTPGLAPP